MDKEQVEQIMTQIEACMASDAFNELEKEIIGQKYIALEPKLDIRRLSRTHKMPMKYIKREIEKVERKLFNILKNGV